jgi:hypothetical protein
VALNTQPPVIWLWISGRDLDGRWRTDATWRHDATRILHVTGHASRWARMRHWKRSAIRNGILTGGTAAAWGMWFHRTATIAVLAVVAVLAAVWGTHKTVRWARLFRHHRDYVQPLHYSLTRELGTPPKQLEIEPDRTRAVIWLPEDFTGVTDRERQAIMHVVTTKLAIEAPDADWSRLQGRRPRVTFTQSDPPPALVKPPDILPAIQKADDTWVVIGKGKHAADVGASLDADSPHWGESMKSGDGKSEVAKNIAVQVAYHGGLLVFLDYKLISHMWARGLPNVAYAGTPYEIHCMLMWLREEITRRNAAALASADIDGHVQGNVGPRILVVAEELNATQDRLRDWWKESGEKGRPPSSYALDEALFIGRQVRVNVLMIGQRLSAKAAGSGDARENIGVRIMCDPSPSAWKMLGFDHVQPPASGHRGRYQVVTAKAVREVQGALWSAQEAREFAVSGEIAIPRHDMPFVNGVAPVREIESPSMQSPDLGIVAQNPSPAPPTATIAEALEAKMFDGATLATVRKRVQRAGLRSYGFQGNAKRYALEDLKELTR